MKKQGSKKATKKRIIIQAKPTKYPKFLDEILGPIFFTNKGRYKAEEKNG